MRSLAGLIVAGPLQAIGIVTLCTVLGYLLPPLTSPLNYVGAAALALYSLATGARGGMLVLLGAAVATGVLAELLLGREGGVMAAHAGTSVVAASLLLWVPVWLSAGVLRATLSLAMALLVLAALAMTGVLLVFVLLGDPALWWQQVLQEMVDRLVEAGITTNGDGLSELVRTVAPLMTGVVASGLEFAAATCLVLGRWWQSLLVKPGALRTEFYALRLNGGLSLAGAAIVAVASLELGVVSDIAAQWALIAMVVFLFVGLAVLHATLARLKAGRMWLIIAYVLMSLLPQALLMVVVTGLLDPWLDLRRRTASG
jgi:hypothetical protein